MEADSPEHAVPSGMSARVGGTRKKKRPGKRGVKFGWFFNS